jgi:hypothetical protein
MRTVPSSTALRRSQMRSNGSSAWTVACDHVRDLFRVRAPRRVSMSMGWSVS